MRAKTTFMYAVLAFVASLGAMEVGSLGRSLLGWSVDSEETASQFDAGSFALPTRLVVRSSGYFVSFLWHAIFRYLVRHDTAVKTVKKIFVYCVLSFLSMPVSNGFACIPQSSPILVEVAQSFILSSCLAMRMYRSHSHTMTTATATATATDTHMKSMFLFFCVSPGCVDFVS